MDNSFQTSFIPKKPIISSGYSEKEPKSLLLIISVFILIASLVAAGGLFLYKTYLTKQKITSSDTLRSTKESFEKETIDNLELFDKRSSAAKNILSKHVVLSPIFELLEKITIPSIQYTSFSLQTINSEYTIEMKGIAKDYRSIAVQASKFNDEMSWPFNNVLFSNLMKNKNNFIDFNLEFNVNKDVLSYEKNISTGIESQSGNIINNEPLSSQGNLMNNGN